MDSACPPEPPLRFAIVLYYLAGSYRSRDGATAAGVEALHTVPQKSVKKNILRISHEIKLNKCEQWNVYSSLSFAMNPAAPDGAPPRQICICKQISKHRTAPPCLGEALRRGAFIKLHGLIIFMIGCELPFMCVSTEPDNWQFI